MSKILKKQKLCGKSVQVNNVKTKLILKSEGIKNDTVDSERFFVKAIAKELFTLYRHFLIKNSQANLHRVAVYVNKPTKIK